MKKHLLLLTLAALLGLTALIPSRASAQFVNGSLYLGPELGLGLGYGGGVVLGGMVESAITNPGTVGSGRLAIAGRIDFYSWSDGYYSYSYIPIGIYCDYHFALDDTRWDPFVGLGLGYVIVSASYSGPSDNNYNYGYGSTVFLAAQAGVRYFVSPSVAIRAELGLGYLPLGVGVDFKI
jgi:hypothetical protein